MSDMIMKNSGAISDKDRCWCAENHGDSYSLLSGWKLDSDTAVILKVSELTGNNYSYDSKVLRSEQAHSASYIVYDPSRVTENEANSLLNMWIGVGRFAYYHDHPDELARKAKQDEKVFNGSWVVDRHEHYVFMSGGGLGCPYDVKDRAYELTGVEYPDDAGVMWFFKPTGACYAVYDSQALDNLNDTFLEWCRNDKNVYWPVDNHSHEEDRNKSGSIRSHDGKLMLAPGLEMSVDDFHRFFDDSAESKSDEGNWTIEKHEHYVFLNGGELGSSAEIVNKAQLLTNDYYSDNVAVLKYAHSGSTCYAIYDSQAPVQLKSMFTEWCNKNDNNYYHEYHDVKIDDVFKKIMNQVHWFKFRFKLYAMLTFLAGLSALTALSFSKNTVFAYIAILILVPGSGVFLHSTAEYNVRESWEQSRLHQFKTKTDIVYIINGLKYDDNEESKLARKLIKSISRAIGINKKNISYKIVDHGIAIIHKNPNHENTTINYTTDELIRHFSNATGGVDELKKLSSVTGSNANLMTKKEIKSTLDEMVALQSNIREFESKALASSSISDEIDAQVKEFKILCESEHAAMSSGEELLGRMKSINASLEKLSKGSVTLDDAMHDLDNATRLKTQSR